MAEDKKRDPRKVTLRNVVISYPNVFTARHFGKSKEGKPAFSIQALVDKKRDALLDKIDAAIEAAKREAFGEKWQKVKIKADNMAMQDGDELNEDAEEPSPERKGQMVIRARNYTKPLVLDDEGEEISESDGLIYGGAICDVIVRFWGQDYEGTKRMNCSVEAVKYKEEGTPFGASKAKASDFDEDDDDDDRPKRRRSRDDDDDDDRPKSRRRSSDDDEDEDRPKSRRRSSDDDEDEDKPRSRRRSSDDDEDEDKPRGRRRSSDDEDEDKPRSRRSSRDDDEDEPRGRRRSRDDDEDEDRPKRRSRDEDDDDDRPRGRRSRRDDLA